MLTTDDFKNIREVVREEINSSEKKVRKVIREEITNLETKMEMLFDKQDKQMEQDRNHWSAFFNDAGIFFDQLVKRI